MQQESARSKGTTREAERAFAWLAAPAESSRTPTQELGELSIDLAHELRTSLAILTLLSGNLDLLYERLDDGRRRKMIRDIRKHMQRLNGLITDILELRDDSEITPL
jgi:signal transduction histidine kinase